MQFGPLSNKHLNPIQKITRNHRVLFIIAVLFIFVSISSWTLIQDPLIASAAFNQQINYQGKLTTNAGIAVTNGTYTMEFSLYTASSGGSPIWTETRTSGNKVQVTSGLFSVMLGSVTALTGVNFNQTLYLGVKIESDAEMTPRKILGAVPAAFEALSFGGATSTQYVRNDQPGTIASSSAATLFTLNQTGAGNPFDIYNGATNLFTVLSGGNIGIGTTTPAARLTIRGGGATSATDDLFLENSSGTKLFKVRNDGYVYSGKTFEVSDGTIYEDTSVLLTGNSNSKTWLFNFYDTGTHRLSLSRSGYFRVGPSISSPAAMGTFQSTAASDKGIIIKGATSQSADYFNISSSGGTGDIMTVLSSGNVGIGKATPGYKLELSNGNTYANVRLVTQGNGYGNPSAATTISDGDKMLFFNETGAKTGYGAGAGNDLWVQASANLTTPAFRVFNGVSGVTPTEIFTLFGNGNVGIGTTTPSNKFEVNGNGFFNGNLTAANITATGTASFASTTLTNFTAGSVPFIGTGGALNQNNSNFFWDNTNARLGIGTASPSTNLEVVGSASTSRLYLTGSVGSADAPNALIFNDIGGSSGNDTIIGRANGNNGLYFNVANGTTYSFNVSGAEKLSISSAGVSLPTETLTGTGDYQSPTGIIFNDTGGTTNDVGIWRNSDGLGINYKSGASGSSLANHNFYFGDTIGAQFLQNGGSPKFYFNGSVGVASSTPLSTLSVSGVAGTNPFTVASSSGNSLFSILSNGNVGVGIANPLAKLHVGGDIVIPAGNKYYFNLTGTPAVDTNWSLGYLSSVGGSLVSNSGIVQTIYNGAGYGYQVKNTSGTSLFEMQGSDGKTYFSGNVGIGTTSPTSKLYIDNNTTAASALSINRAATTGGYYTDIRMLTAGVAKWYMGMDSDLFSGTDTFGINNGVATQGISILQSNGNVGVGSTTPLSTLSVTGTAGTNPFTVASSTGNSLFTILPSGNVGIGTANPGAKLDIFNGDVRIAGASDTANLGTIIFGTNNSSRYLRGNSATVQIGSALNVMDFEGTSEVTISNAAADGTNAFKFKRRTASASGNNFVFDEAGTAQMVIDHAGNVGIGTTTPSNFKLQVAGNIGPDANDTYNLGTQSNRFNTIFTSFLTGGGNGANDWRLDYGLKLASTGYVRFTTTGNSGGTIDTGLERSSAGVIEINNGTTGTLRDLSVRNISAASTTLSNFTQGSIPFIGTAGALNQNNSNFFWDNANARLGIGTANPSNKLNVVGIVDIGSSLANTGSPLNIKVDGSGKGFVVDSGTTGDYTDFISGGVLKGMRGFGSVPFQISSAASSLTLTTTGSSNNIVFTPSGNSIFSSGNVGIGTTTLGYQLAIANSTNGDNGILVTNNSSGAAARNLIRLANDVGNVGQLSIWGSGTGSLANKTFFESTKDFVIGVDAGVASGGSSKFQVYTGGFNNVSTPQFTINGSGNVGIGSTTPLSTLSVTGTAGTNPFTVASSTGNSLFTILPSGNVGIGTPTPGSKLEVIGSVSSGNAGTGFISVNGLSRNISSDGNITFTGSIYTAANLYDLGISASQGWRDLFLSRNAYIGGNLGIGTTTPSNKFEVNGNGYFNGNLTAANITATGTLTVSGASSLNGALTFLTDNTYDIGASGATRARTGYFGTSVVAPTINATTALQLGGSDINSAGILSNVAYKNAANTFTNASGNTFTSAGGSGTVTSIATGSSGVALALNAPSGANHLVFQTGGIQKWIQYLNGNDFRFYESGASDRLTLQAGGNVGIGTTSPNNTLQVVGSGIALGNPSAGTFHGNSLLNFDDRYPSLQFKTGATVQAQILSDVNTGDLYFDKGAGSMIFRNVNSTEWMRIAASGNVGIGTTTPSNKLEVNGNGYFNGNLTAANITATGTASFASTTLTNFTAGSIPFIGTGGALNQNNSNFFWDNTNARLGIGTTTPDNLIQVKDLIDFNNANVSTKIGYRAGKNIPSDAFWNTFIGYEAGFGDNAADSGASLNTALGWRSLYSVSSGGYNTAVGWGSLHDNTSGTGNTSLGESSLYSNTTGGYNVGIGEGALYYNSTANQNVGIGQSSLFNNTKGYNNVGIGYNTLYDLNVTSDANTNNTAIGSNTGRGIVTGTNNTIIGANVQGLPAGLSGNIILADGAGNRRINVDSSGNVGIGTTTPSYMVDVAKAYGGAVIERIANTQAGGSNYAGLRVESDNTAIGTWLIQTSTTYSGTGGYQANAGVIDSGGPGGFSLMASGGSGNIRLYTGGQAASNERLRITTSGNVGIGTTTPSNIFEVNGNGYFNGNLTAANITATGTLSVKATSTLRSILPETNLLYNLGSSAARFNEGWISTLNVGTSTWSITQGTAGRFSIFDAASAEGTERLTILPTSGNVGIGTTSPSELLYVGSLASPANIGLTLSDTNGAIRWYNSGGAVQNAIRSLANKDMQFVTNGAETLRMTSGGNVGIGSTTPGEKLTLVDAGNAHNYASPLTFGMYANNLSQGIGFGYDGITKIGSTANSDLYMNAKGTGNLVLQNSATGNVGIGTTAPTAGKLQITATAGASFPTVLALRSGNSPTYGWDWQVDDAVSGDMQLNRVLSGSSSQVMSFLRTNGNVGIGTTSPAAKLQITTSTANDSEILALQNITGWTSGKYNQLTFRDGTNVAGAIGMVYQSTTGTVDFTVNSLYNSAYKTTSDVPFIVKGNGNVGIGTASPLAKLHINQAGASSYILGVGLVPTATNYASVIQNNTTGALGSSGTSQLAILNTKSQAVGDVTGLAFLGPWRSNASVQEFWTLNSVLTAADGAGNSSTADFVFNTKPAGVYPNANTEVMRLTSGGNVGIGTNAPGVALQVNGILRAATANDAGILSLGESAGGTAVNVGAWRGALNSLSNGNYLNLGGYDGIGLSTGNANIGSQTLRMRIDVNGNVGIGAAPDLVGNYGGGNAGRVLTLQGASQRAMLELSNASTGTGGTAGQIGFLNSTTQIAAILGNTEGATNSGNLAFWTMNAGTITEKIHINPAGNIRFLAYGAGTLTTDGSGNITASSDERLKNVNGSFDRGLSDIMGLNPINYHWKASSGLDTVNSYAGFSAQNVQQFIPEAVGQDPKGFLTLQDRPILAALVNATKELANNASSTKSNLTSVNVRLSYLESIGATSASGNVAGSLGDMWSTLQSFGSEVMDGIAYVQKMFVQNLTVGSKKHPSGITLYDQATGDPYCVVIVNGAMVNNPGECPEVTASSTPLVPGQHTTGATSDPQTSPSPLITPTDATSGGSSGTSSDDPSTPPASDSSSSSEPSIPPVVSTPDPTPVVPPVVETLPIPEVTAPVVPEVTPPEPEPESPAVSAPEVPAI